MAVIDTFSVLTTGNSTGAGTSFNTASVTLTAGRLYLIAIVNATTEAVSSVTNFTAISGADRIYNGGGQRITVLRALPASTLTGALTITMAASAAFGIWWQIYELTGDYDTGGTNGSAAVVRAESNDGIAIPSLTVTLPTFGSASNGTVGVFTTLGPSITPEAGYTATAEDATWYSQPKRAQWRADNDTTVTATWASGTGAGIALEIANGTGGGGGGPPANTHRLTIPMG